MDTLTEYWFPLVIFGVVGIATLDGIRRRRKLVRNWALSRNLTLLRRLPAWYRISPFPFDAILGHQRIEYWLVRDLQGVEHRVWLKIGDFFFGTLTGRIVEKWET